MARKIPLDLLDQTIRLGGGGGRERERKIGRKKKKRERKRMRKEKLHLLSRISSDRIVGFRRSKR